MRGILLRALPLSVIVISAPHPGGASQWSQLPADAFLKLERTVCGGECPAYNVTIDAQGNVVYEGIEFVRVTGRQTARIPPSQVAAIFELADTIGFFDLEDQYRFIRNPDGTETIVTDQPTTFVTITRDGRTKRVEDYIRAPDSLRELERKIDDVTRTKQCVFLDESMLEQLARSRWTPSAEEKADLLRKAVQHDDIPILKGLLKLGADPNAGYFGTETPPLMLILSAEAARVLLDAGADPFKRNVYGGTPLGSAAHLPAEVTALLLKTGAPVDEPHDRDGRTPLWSASCAGNAGVVAVLLGAGANPATSVQGLSALNCARTERDAARLRQPSILPLAPPYATDFGSVIELLEAHANRSRVPK